MTTAFEVNFDGLAGPTHRYSGLALGNIAATAHEGEPSNPRRTALQGLAKMKRLHDLGVMQGVLPPQRRPHLRLFRTLGLCGTNAQILAQAGHEMSDLLARCFSASSMWTANCATVTPAADAADGKAHFTPANQVTNYHRAIESDRTAAVLRKVFADERLFAHHPPLPPSGTFADEGAANHCRFCPEYGSAGLHLFVYGRDGLKAGPSPKKFPARQTRAACEALRRQHGTAPRRTLFVQQNPDVIDAGIFHNDVIAASNRDIFFYHELAYIDTPAVVARLCELFEELASSQLRPVEVTARELSLEQAVSSYLFNSQIVTTASGRTVLVAPMECKRLPQVNAYLDQLKSRPVCPFDDIVFVDVTESMKNGGGPACLRLRVVLTEEQLTSIKPNVLFTEELYDRLKEHIEKTYPEAVSTQDLKADHFVTDCRRAVDGINEILGLDPDAD